MAESGPSGQGSGGPHSGVLGVIGSEEHPVTLFPAGVVRVTILGREPHADPDPGPTGVGVGTGSAGAG